MTIPYLFKINIHKKTNKLKLVLTKNNEVP